LATSRNVRNAESVVMANGDAADGPTPVTPEEALQLRVSVQSRDELNAFERENILEAREWALSPRTLRRDDLLTEEFLRDLHRRMLRRVWRWAGRFRTSERNMGRPVHTLAMDVRTLLDDARYWLEHGTYPAIETAVRCHHRLVAIHPWVNGNGRHARLMADIIVCARGGEPLSWGRSADLVAPSVLRTRYLTALREADAGNHGPLLTFATGGEQ
jgi:Fic-DOC domain mobile mystery protein B